MSPYQEILAGIDERLDLPQPARSRVLLEIAADLDDLYRHFRAEGLDEGPALEEARLRMDLSDEALAELKALHSGSLRQYLDRLGRESLSRLEKVLFASLLCFVLAFTGRLLLTEPIFRQAGPFVWPVILASGSAVLTAARVFYRLNIRQDHQPGRLRRGVPLLAGLAVFNLATGLIGFWDGLRRAAQLIVQNVDQTLVYLVDWLLEGSALLIAAFLAAILVALLWFWLDQRTTSIQTAEAALLLGQPDFR